MKKGLLKTRLNLLHHHFIFESASSVADICSPKKQGFYRNCLFETSSRDARQEKVFCDVEHLRKNKKVHSYKSFHAFAGPFFYFHLKSASLQRNRNHLATLKYIFAFVLKKNETSFFKRVFNSGVPER